jgi:hypothetical protein
MQQLAREPPTGDLERPDAGAVTRIIGGPPGLSSSKCAC